MQLQADLLALLPLHSPDAPSAAAAPRSSPWGTAASSTTGTPATMRWLYRYATDESLASESCTCTEPTIDLPETATSGSSHLLQATLPPCADCNTTSPTERLLPSPAYVSKRMSMCLKLPFVGQAIFYRHPCHHCPGRPLHNIYVQGYKASLPSAADAERLFMGCSRTETSATSMAKPDPPQAPLPPCAGCAGTASIEALPLSPAVGN